MVALETIQQFAMLNQITSVRTVGALHGNSYPINASYSPRIRTGRSCYAGATPARLARVSISTTRTTRMATTKPSLRVSSRQTPGLLCLLGALGDHQRPVDKYQSEGRLSATSSGGLSGSELHLRHLDSADCAARKR